MGTNQAYETPDIHYETVEMGEEKGEEQGEQEAIYETLAFWCKNFHTAYALYYKGTNIIFAYFEWQIATFITTINYRTFCVWYDYSWSTVVM